MLGKSGVLAIQLGRQGSIIMTWVGANFTTKDVCCVYIIVVKDKQEYF